MISFGLARQGAAIASASRSPKTAADRLAIGPTTGFPRR
jgi:hypothetical protein